MFQVFHDENSFSNNGIIMVETNNKKLAKWFLEYKRDIYLDISDFVEMNTEEGFKDFYFGFEELEDIIITKYNKELIKNTFLELINGI